MSRIRLVLHMLPVLVAGCGDRAVAPDPLTPRIDVAVAADAGFPGDVIAATAVVRDSAGVIVPGAPVTWAVSDSTRAELSPAGVLTLLAPGTVIVRARSGALTASRSVTVRPLTVQSITIGDGVLRLDRGDITPVGVRVQGEGGRDVLGRAVQLSVDDASIAVVDGAGRVRAVAPGVTTLRASVDGKTGTARVEVATDSARLVLSRLDNTALPVLVVADSVTWDGEREFHEVWMEGGHLTLSGGSTPRYQLTIRHVEYDVRTVGGVRHATIRRIWHENDRGVVAFDARGDLAMTSEVVAPLHHTAMPVSGGFLVRYRVPGDDQILQLFYRREPK